jgi:hypothetical protein
MDILLDDVFYLSGSFGNMLLTRSQDSGNNEDLYHYIPTEWVGILFLTLFSISTSMSLGENPFHSESGMTHRNIAALHIVQAVRYRW